MANHNLPTLTSTYANFITEMDSRMDDISMGFDPALTTATNLTTGAIRWTSAGSKWQKWSGTAWSDLSTLFAINISGSAGSVANGLYSTSSYANPTWITSLAGSKITGDISGNAGGVANGVYTTGSYANPAWITSLAGSKITGDISGNAGSVTNGVYITGSYSNPAWITALAGTKVTGDIAGASASAAKLTTARTINGVSFDGTVNISVNTNSTVTVSNSGSGSASGTSFNGSTALTISYNSIGAPSVTGANATGTWGISVSGNAATVSNGVYTVGAQTIAGIKSFTDQILIKNGTATAPAIAFDGEVNHDTGIYWGGNGYINFTAEGIYAGQITPTGGLTMVGDITAYSDTRLKKDLVRISGALDKIDALAGYTYTRIDTGRRQTGLLAQDVQAVAPEAVLEGEYLSVAYGNLMGLIVEGIKELRQELASIKNQIR